MALKKEKEVLNDIEEKDQYESLHDFTAGKKYFRCSQDEKTEKISTRKKAQKTGIIRSDFTSFRFGKSFSERENLKVHIGKTLFSCQHCGKSFTFKQSLNNHVRIHTGEKPYTCQQCGESFAHLVNLKVHMTIHTGESPFTCVENFVLLKCRKLRREDQETSDWIVSRISLFYDMCCYLQSSKISS